MPQVLDDNLIGRKLIPYPLPCGSMDSFRIFDIAPWGPVKPAVLESIFLHQPIFDLVRFDLNVGDIHAIYRKVRYYLIRMLVQGLYPTGATVLFLLALYPPTLWPACDVVDYENHLRRRCTLLPSYPPTLVRRFVVK